MRALPRSGPGDETSARAAGSPLRWDRRGVVGATCAPLAPERSRCGPAARPLLQAPQAYPVAPRPASCDGSVPAAVLLQSPWWSLLGEPQFLAGKLFPASQRLGSPAA